MVQHRPIVEKETFDKKRFIEEFHKNGRRCAKKKGGKKGWRPLSFRFGKKGPIFVLSSKNVYQYWIKPFQKSVVWPVVVVGPFVRSFVRPSQCLVFRFFLFLVMFAPLFSKIETFRSIKDNVVVVIIIILVGLCYWD